MILQVVSHVHHHFSVFFCYIFVFVETCVVKTPGVSILLVVFYIQLSNEKKTSLFRLYRGITKKNIIRIHIKQPVFSWKVRPLSSQLPTSIHQSLRCGRSESGMVTRRVLATVNLPPKPPEIRVIIAGLMKENPWLIRTLIGCLQW